MTLQVDGDESDNTGTVCVLRVLGARRSLFAGATVAEMADLMVAAGAWSAIELDGGGSSTTVIFRPSLAPLSRATSFLINRFAGV